MNETYQQGSEFEWRCVIMVQISYKTGDFGNVRFRPENAK